MSKVGEAIAAICFGLFALALSGLSAAGAWEFGLILGAGERGREILAALGAAFVLSKPFWPLAIRAAWHRRSYPMGLLFLFVLLLAVAYSSLASYSYGVAQRAPGVAAADSEASARDELRRIGPTRPAAAIFPLIAIERDRAARASLESEYQTARRAEALRTQLDKPAAVSAETGTREIAGFAKIDASTMRSAIVLLATVLIELGELSGLYAAMLLWPRHEPAPLDPGRHAHVKRWLANRLEEGPKASKAVLYAEYLEHRKDNKKRPSCGKATFYRLIDEV